MIKCEPCSARTAPARSSPCVSEMSPNSTHSGPKMFLELAISAAEFYALFVRLERGSFGGDWASHRSRPRQRKNHVPEIYFRRRELHRDVALAVARPPNRNHF